MRKLRTFVAVAVVSCAWPIADRAACTVSIVDNSPIPGLVKNVGQEVVLSANIIGTFSSVTWTVEGEVIDDYEEREPGPFSLTNHIEVGAAPPVASFSGNSIRFYW